ncbi:MAG: nicotinamide mononucleotide transporter [Bacteroidetes bacterium]|nr:nicotinamide mononucleotide transporter [Bacteroidota bacterium]
MWIIANIMYMGIYMQKELYLYSILFLIYLILAFYGLYIWKKLVSHQTNR